MSTTPSKNVESSCNFIPKEILTPNKEWTHGLSKTVFNHVLNLQRLINDWTKVCDSGRKICKAISALKLHECFEDYFPHQLKPLTESLSEALDSLLLVVEGIEIITKQLKALTQLDNSNEPVIYSWSIQKIYSQCHRILETIQKEYRLKHVVSENIAHCRDEKLIEVFVSSWEFGVYFKSDHYAYLFADVGV